MDEIWKPILGYEDRYMINQVGVVKSIRRLEFMKWKNSSRVWAEKILHQYTKENLYLFVTLSDGGGYKTQGKKIYLGKFQTEELAYDAYVNFVSAIEPNLKHL